MSFYENKRLFKLAHEHVPSSHFLRILGAVDANADVAGSHCAKQYQIGPY